MARSLDDSLSSEKALIFRITHVENVRWIFENGLWCQASETRDPEFVSIGNPELIDLRSTREVPLPPGGTLGDYVPFYFTPHSPMLLNITTGWAGIAQRKSEELVFLVTSLPHLAAKGIAFTYTDRHAYLATARFSNDMRDLGEMVSYDLLRSRDFRRDPEAPERAERYQAEALVHRHLPCDALLGVACYTQEIKARIEEEAANRQVSLPVRVRRSWYFA